MRIDPCVLESKCSNFRAISIIIPAYRAEATIARAVESVLAADCDLEVIVIDDGSDDATSEIVSRIGRRDMRVRLIRQENMGRCAARNAGLDVAHGRWVAFLDADDWYLPGAFQTLLERADDFAQGVWGQFETSAGQKAFGGEVEMLGANELSARLLHPLERSRMEPDEDGTLYRSVWGKLYRRRSIEEHGLRFAPGLRFGEDALFNVSFLQWGGRVALVDRPIYHYDIQNSSTVARFDERDGEYLRRFVREAERLRHSSQHDIDTDELIGSEALTLLRRAARTDLPTAQLSESLVSAFSDASVMRGICSSVSSGLLSRVRRRLLCSLLSHGDFAGAVRVERLILVLRRAMRRGPERDART